MEVPATNIVQEYPVYIEGMAQRADVVVMDADQKPLMLVECKAPAVKIDQAVKDQAVRYNNILKCRYIMLTNGLKHYFYATYDGRTYDALESVPIFK